MNRRLKLFICWTLMFISIVILAIEFKSSVLIIEHEKNVMSGLEFIDVIEGNVISYAAWEASVEQIYYLVLPSAYQGNKFDVEVSYEDRFYSIYIDEIQYKSGERWTEELCGKMHQLKIVDFMGKIRMEKPFQVLVSKDVPAIMITVDAKEELFNETEYANKQYIEKGDIVILEKNGKILLNETMDRFKVRGNLTSTFEKKPFTFTLPEAVSLYEMSESQNWNLLSNASDGSHIRNKMMLDWADELFDRYQPNGEWVDLFVNGEYQGLYLLTETIENRENRVSLDSSKDILLEMELYERVSDEKNYIVTNQGHYWVVHEDTYLLEDELRVIEEYLNNIESALYTDDGISEISGQSLDELIDFDSWTDMWLIEEMSADHDMGTTSQFAIARNYKDGSSLLAGPAWDYDITMGNGMIPLAKNPRCLMAAVPNTRGIDSVTQNKWLSQMYQHEEFKELLIKKFVEEVQPKITRLLEYEIDNYAERIRYPALLDSLRWNGNGINRAFCLPENYTLKEEEDYYKYDVMDVHIDMIKTFLHKKERFLNELWVEGIEFDVIIEERNCEGMALDLNNNIYTWVRKN